MAKHMMLFYLLVVLITLQEAKALSPVVIELEACDHNSNLRTSALEIFEKGKYSPFSQEISALDPTKPPRALRIVAPSEAGKYPIILFNHGTSLQTSLYSDLFDHISSHGYIIVAPQYYEHFPIGGEDELEWAIRVANWLPEGFKSILPDTWDQKNLALAGHSRGGLIAFAMALGKQKKTSLQVHISALIGIDPVAGRGSYDPIEPYILTYEPHSFNISVPVTVIGTGLGDKPRYPLGLGVCAPERINHYEFFNESKAPSSHFVATYYGHIDMLNDQLTSIEGALAEVFCTLGNGPRKVMRSTVGGIVVAFLKAYICGEVEDYVTIIANPSVAPTMLDLVEFYGELASDARV